MSLRAKEVTFFLFKVAELYDRIVRKYQNQWHHVAEKQAKTILNPSEVEARQQAARYIIVFLNC